MARKRAVLLGPLATLVAVLLSGGCGDDNGTGPGNGGGDITVPLKVGNRWSYQVTETESRPATEYPDTTRVTGTVLVGGHLYYQLVSGPAGERDTVLVRQVGQDILAIPGDFNGGEPAEDPIEDWLGRVMRGSLPWKFADFDAAANSTWTILQADTTATIEGVSMTMAIEFKGRSMGRTSVTVPAGTYQGAYMGKMEMTITVTVLGQSQSMTSTQSFWIANGVGIVQTQEVEGDPAEGTEYTRTDRLVSYSLQ